MQAEGVYPQARFARPAKISFSRMQIACFALQLTAGQPAKGTHNADSIIESKVIYYLENVDLESK